MSDKKTVGDGQFVPVTLSFVTFFALREIIAEIAERKGPEAEAWKKRINDRVMSEMSKFTTKGGKPIDASQDPETKAIISTLLRDPKKDVS